MGIEVKVGHLRREADINEWWAVSFNSAVEGEHQGFHEVSGITHMCKYSGYE